MVSEHHKAVLKGVSLKAAIAELVATTLFVFIGCGTASTFSATQGPNGFTLGGADRSSGNVVQDITLLTDSILTNGNWGVTTALAFGLAITVLAYATSHLSGGQLNPAVTLGLVLSGALSVAQGILNAISQFVGAILGAAFIRAMLPNGRNSVLGTNATAPGVSTGNAICGEIIMTFTLVLVVLETAKNKKSTVSNNAPLAIGFAVFCAHAVLLPIDGCCINPARWLGPAIVSGTWAGNSWLFVVGPFAGAILTVPFHLFFRSDWDTGRVTGDPLNVAPSAVLPSHIGQAPLASNPTYDKNPELTQRRPTEASV